MAEIAASVLLKLSINGYDDDTPLRPPWRMNMNSILKCEQHTIHDRRGPEKYNWVFLQELPNSIRKKHRQPTRITFFLYFL